MAQHKLVIRGTKKGTPFGQKFFKVQGSIVFFFRAMRELHAFLMILEFLSVYLLTCRNYSVFSKHRLQYITFNCSKPNSLTN